VASCTLVEKIAQPQTVNDRPPVVNTKLGEEKLLASANSAFERSNYQMAVAFYSALELDETSDQNASILLKHAAAEDYLARYERSNTLYRSYIDAYGETAEVLNNMGYSNLLQGNFTIAEDLFRRAALLDQSHTLIKNNLVLTEKLKGYYKWQ
jgi:Flp pilus assembly protein TadD